MRKVRCGLQHLTCPGALGFKPISCTFQHAEQAPGRGSQDEDAPKVLPLQQRLKVDRDVEPEWQRHKEQRVDDTIQASLYACVIRRLASTCRTNAPINACLEARTDPSS